MEGPRPRCGEAECGGAEEDAAGHGQQEEAGGRWRELSLLGTSGNGCVAWFAGLVSQRVPAGGDERLLNVLSATVALLIGQPNTDWHTVPGCSSSREKNMCATVDFF